MQSSHSALSCCLRRESRCSHCDCTSQQGRHKCWNRRRCLRNRRWRMMSLCFFAHSGESRRRSHSRRSSGSGSGQRRELRSKPVHHCQDGALAKVGHVGAGTALRAVKRAKTHIHATQHVHNHPEHLVACVHQHKRPPVLFSRASARTASSRQGGEVGGERDRRRRRRRCNDC